MKPLHHIIFLTLFAPLLGAAQDTIYRCGNEYTNNAADAKQRGCKQVQGGHVTVIAAPKSSGTRAISTGSGGTASGTPRVDANDQRTRDSDARSILDAELRRTQARQAELIKEYNGGEPEKQGLELRNHQKYLDRVAELKAAIARGEEDMAGIRREISRNAGGASASK